MVRRAAVRGLHADATKTAGVADRRSRDRRLPAAKEQILGSKAVIINSAARQLLDQPVLRKLSNHLPDQRIQLSVIVVLWEPVLVIVHPSRGHHETLSILVPAHRRIRPKRQMHRLLTVVAGGKQRPHVARRHESRDRLHRDAAPSLLNTAHRNEAALPRVPGNRRSIRDSEDTAILRKRDQFHRFRQKRIIGAHPGHIQMRVVEDVPLAIRVEKFRQFFSFHGYPIHPPSDNTPPFEKGGLGGI